LRVSQSCDSEDVVQSGFFEQLIAVFETLNSEDYDGNGEIEQVYDELMGLNGLQITVQGHMQSENWMSVFTINNLLYREQGQPIWTWEHHWRWRNS